MGGMFGGGRRDEPPPPLPMPEAPKVDKVADEAAQKTKRRKAELTKTIYTAPLGLSGQADVSRKTLLGQ